MSGLGDIDASSDDVALKSHSMMECKTSYTSVGLTPTPHIDDIEQSQPKSFMTARPMVDGCASGRHLCRASITSQELIGVAQSLRCIHCYESSFLYDHQVI